MAADDAAVVVVVVSAPPPPKPAPTPCRLATALDYLFLASIWVTCASVAALTVAGRASGTDSPVYHALLLTVEGAFLLVVLAVVACCLHEIATGLHLVKAFVAAVKNKKVSFWKVLAASIREKDTSLLACLACALFYLIAIIGALMMQVLPGEECHRIGAALYDLGILVDAAICCFILVPILALKIPKKNKYWRSSIVIPEAKTMKGDVSYHHEAQVSDLKFPTI